MSTRQEIIAEIRARVARILIAGGFQTDAGSQVFIAETPTIGPDDAPSGIAIVIEDDHVGYQGEKVSIVLPVNVQGLASIGASDPWSVVEAIVADIKKAIENNLEGARDFDLGGLLLPRGLGRGSTRSLRREEGTTYVGASVEYRLSYAEAWGAP